MSQMAQEDDEGQECASLKDLLDAALEPGVKFMACQMCMDVVGLTKEDFAQCFVNWEHGYFLEGGW